MQTLLNDIELDIQELKFLIQAISGDANPALRVVAKRSINQMQGRLSLLLSQLDEPSVSIVADEDIPSPVCEVPVCEVPVDAPVDAPVDIPIISEPVLPIVNPTAPARTEPTIPTTNAASPILAERIKSATDLRHAISLNDSFRFTRELFDGDAARMNQIVREIGEAPTLDKALDIYMSTVCPDEDNEASADFIELLKKYFN